MIVAQLVEGNQNITWMVTDFCEKGLLLASILQELLVSYPVKVNHHCLGVMRRL